MIDRRAFLRGAGALLIASGLPHARADGPAPKKGRLLFGYPSGAMGTQLAQGCLPILAGLGMDYQLENVDARNTREASERVKNAPPDGTVLLQAQSTSMCLLPNVYRTLGYDPLKDFAPLATLGEFALSLTVGAQVPAHITTLAQYLEWLTDNPDFRDVGFSIYGSQGHLSTLILARAKGVTVRAQPYRGSTMMINDLLNGTLAAGFTAAGNGNTSLWSSGKLRSLGVTTAKRLAYWPTIPTLLEQGVADMDINAWFAWYAPAATPPGVTGALRQALGALQASAAFAALQKQFLLTPLVLTPEQIDQRTREEIARYGQLVAAYDLNKLE
ncbi:Bug family tripartite tricarboxylate transporter substrate binding protein [Pseudomonas mangiferae]|uniref:Tripartite tricarboxylate transporter substrate binding protein n=1 Tax=Pseudomonas mangiferae TaxID=2593654 RepID=A0A553H447_9PSED|nr:tripartite tricarboxylate transporter substrate-binding protein [Pseudomonas mangiferae]TRX76525.1 tripartite tricarboxylate transporter substrate binding protein [Pseudomonas mangiferae]